MAYHKVINNEEGRRDSIAATGAPGSSLSFPRRPALRRALVRAPPPACPGGLPLPRATRSLPGAGQARLPGLVLAAGGGASRKRCGGRDRRRDRIEPLPLLKVLHAE